MEFQMTTRNSASLIRDTAINSSFKENIRRPTFSKQALLEQGSFKLKNMTKDQVIFKSAQEAIGEVK